MKKLLSLLLIIFVSAISWYSCPQKKVINVTTIYNLTYPVEHSLLLTPTLTTRKTTESINFSQAKVVSEHNRFFEFSIVFNENLQQTISFFTHLYDVISTLWLIDSLHIPTTNQR